MFKPNRPPMMGLLKIEGTAATEATAQVECLKAGAWELSEGAQSHTGLDW
jgi:hypothetical protein